MISNNTMRAVPMKVAILGSPNVGRSTFLKSLQPEDAEFDAGTTKSSVAISVRDIANNMQLSLVFSKIDVQEQDLDGFLAGATCVLLMYDVTSVESFQYVT